MLSAITEFTVMGLLERLASTSSPAGSRDMMVPEPGVAPKVRPDLPARIVAVLKRRVCPANATVPSTPE